MTTGRRVAPVHSEMRSRILDGAEAVLSDEGYAMLTSGRIAYRIGVKQQLVFYYFRNMDELIVETFRRLARREESRLEQLLDGHRALREMWDIGVSAADARLIAEFMALAHRNAALRREVAGYVERMRCFHVEALARAAKPDQSALAAVPAVAISFLATSAALALSREAAIGVSAGHLEVKRLIERSIAALAGEAATSPQGEKTRRPADETRTTGEAR